MMEGERIEERKFFIKERFLNEILRFVQVQFLETAVGLCYVACHNIGCINFYLLGMFINF